MLKPSTTFTPLACSVLTLGLLTAAHAQSLPWQIQAGIGINKVLAGRLQTTAGGTAGSATPEYPTFKQLGLESGSAYQLRIERQVGQHYVAISTQQFNPSANAQLGQDLIVQGKQFSAGSTVSSRLRFNQYRLTYGYRLALSPALTITPLAAFNLWQFSLRMHSPSITGSVDRSYQKGSVQLGSEMRYRLYSWLTLGAHIDASLPLPNQPQIINARINAALEVHHSPTSRTWLVASLQDETVQYNDHNKQAAANQGANTLSNDILSQAITPSVGVRVSF